MVSRRSLFGAVGCVGKTSAALVPILSIDAPAPVRVFVDGVDVTSSCYRAELFAGGRGIAYCYERNARGDFFVVGEDLARVEISGRMEIFSFRRAASEGGGSGWQASGAGGVGRSLRGGA